MLRKNCIKASAKDDDDDDGDGDDVTENGGNAQELPEREREGHESAQERSEAEGKEQQVRGCD